MRDPIVPGDLPAHWRERARFLAEYGDPNTARLWELAAVELEQGVRSQNEETLSLVEAARESGFTADHIGSLVRNGKIPNHGRKNAPRVRRADLPIKQPGGPGRPPSPRRALREQVRSIARHSLNKEDR